MGLNSVEDMKRQFVQMLSDNNKMSKDLKDKTREFRSLQKKNEKLQEKLRMIRDKVAFYVGVSEKGKKIYPEWVVEILSEDFGK